jgi:hypothetical protein
MLVIKQLCLFIGLLFIILVIIGYLLKKENFKGDVDPCIDFLSDKDYLVHMIPHHQVAVDMCNLMIPISKSKTIQNIYRKIIWNQNIEINLMNQVLLKIPSVSNNIESIYRDSELKTSLSDDPRSIPKDYYCDPLFFKPNDHSEHMKHMKHTDKSFLEHMIPHHQVAVVMSNRLLKYTNNTHMIRICYDIITSQRYEILQMNYILDYMNKNDLEFLPDYY